MAHWVVRLPGFVIAGDDLDGVLGKDDVVARHAAYAGSFGAPVREGVRVTALEHGPTDARFRARTQETPYVELGVNSVTNPRRGALEQGPTARGRVG